MRWTFLFSGILQGIWLLIDGLQLLRGVADRFSANEVWNALVERLGLDPARFGPVLLVLGILWLLVTMAVVAGWPRARSAAVIVAAGTLWYAIPGTILALINLFALWTLRTRNVART